MFLGVQYDLMGNVPRHLMCLSPILFINGLLKEAGLGVELSDGKACYLEMTL